MNVNIDVNWNTKLIENKINSLITDDVLLQIQTLFAKTIEPWTPYWHGDLSTDITIDSTGVTYNVPYAKKQYYESLAYHKDVHPLATKLWDKVAMQSEMENFENQVKEILIERAREIYG